MAEEQLEPVAEEQLEPVAEEQLEPVAEEQLEPVAEEQPARSGLVAFALAASSDTVDTAECMRTIVGGVAGSIVELASLLEEECS